MKISHVALGITIYLLANTCWSMLPPKYLRVPHWQRCVGTTTQGTAKFVCLPHFKPMNCSSESWRMLNGEQMLDHCPK
jgi:hypothetical protein